jgi:hypothetical protein
MRCATILVVRVLANVYSKLVHPRKLFRRAGFQQANFPLPKMLAGKMPALHTAQIF